MNKKRDEQGFIAIIIIVLVVVAIIFIASLPTTPDTSHGNTSQHASPPVTAPAAQTPASTLASYDIGANPTASQIVPYQKALDDLKPYCTEDQTKLAELIYGSWKDLGNNGIKDETNLSIAQHLLASIPPNSSPTGCGGLLAAYLVLREPHN